MKNIKNYESFINESINNDKLDDAIQELIINRAIYFGLDDSDHGDLHLWMGDGYDQDSGLPKTQPKTPTDKDFDEFWKYVKSVYNYLYTDWFETWDDENYNETTGMNEKEAIKYFVNNIDTFKERFKNTYMKQIKILADNTTTPNDTSNTTNGILSGDELMNHILTKYVDQIEKENDMADFPDEFEYYDNIITWSVIRYLETERPNDDEDDDLIDELSQELKEYWSPI